MKINRIVLLVGAFLALGSGLMLSRVWSTTQREVDRTSSIQVDGQAPEASRGEMAKVVDRDPAAAQAARIATAGPILLDTGPARVTLKAAEAGVTPAVKLTSLAANHRVYLIVAEMSAAEQPGVPYYIFFDLASEANPNRNDPHYVGTITFFNAVKLEGTSAESTDPRFFSFDITGIIRKLQSRKMLTDETTVTVKPVGVPAAGTQARIGRLDLVEQ